MATKLKTFDFTAPSAITQPTEKAVYPWEQWLDGDIWQIREGEDFTTHPLMMERIIRTRATARGAKVRLRHQPLNGDRSDPFGVIILQRSDVKGPADAKKAERAAARAEKKAAAAKDAQEFLAKTGIKTTKKAAAAPKKAVAKRPSKAVKHAVSKRPSKRVAKVGA
jgi:hypothetical protein